MHVIVQLVLETHHDLCVRFSMNKPIYTVDGAETTKIALKEVQKNLVLARPTVRRRMTTCRKTTTQKQSDQV